MFLPEVETPNLGGSTIRDERTRGVLAAGVMEYILGCYQATDSPDHGRLGHDMPFCICCGVIRGTKLMHQSCFCLTGRLPGAT